MIEKEVGAQQKENDAEAQNSGAYRAKPKYNSTGLSANIEAIKELEDERMDRQPNVSKHLTHSLHCVLTLE